MSQRQISCAKPDLAVCLRGPHTHTHTPCASGVFQRESYRHVYLRVRLARRYVYLLVPLPKGHIIVTGHTSLYRSLVESCVQHIKTMKSTRAALLYTFITKQATSSAMAVLQTRQSAKVGFSSFFPIALRRASRSDDGQRTADSPNLHVMYTARMYAGGPVRRHNLPLLLGAHAGCISIQRPESAGCSAAKRPVFTNIAVAVIVNQANAHNPSAPAGACGRCLYETHPLRAVCRSSHPSVVCAREVETAGRVEEVFLRGATTVHPRRQPSRAVCPFLSRRRPSTPRLPSRLLPYVIGRVCHIAPSSRR